MADESPCSNFILAVLGLGARMLSRSFRMFTVQQGLVMPHASSFFAIFMLLFSGFETCVIIEQAKAANDVRPLPPLAVLGVGVVWIFACVPSASPYLHNLSLRFSGLVQCQLWSLQQDMLCLYSHVPTDVAVRHGSGA